MGAVALLTAAHVKTQSGQANAAKPIGACTLLTAAEVKKLAGVADPLNLYERMRPEEETVGKGSSCNYPSMHVQIDPFPWTTVESVRAKNTAEYEAVPGVGDAAFLRANKAAASLEFAELYARIGAHVVTIQMDVPDGSSTASVKSGLVALANAYIAKLR